MTAKRIMAAYFLLLGKARRASVPRRGGIALISAKDAQPRGLRVIVMTEALDRFSFYGMITLLPLYLNAVLLQPGVIENVIGLSAF